MTMAERQEIEEVGSYIDPSPFPGICLDLMLFLTVDRLVSLQERIHRRCEVHADSVRLATEQFKVIKNRQQYLAALETALERMKEEDGPERSRVDLEKSWAELRVGVFKVLLPSPSVMKLFVEPVATCALDHPIIIQA